jgi:hypothetical protein
MNPKVLLCLFNWLFHNKNEMLTYDLQVFVIIKKKVFNLQVPKNGRISYRILSWIVINWVKRLCVMYNILMITGEVVEWLTVGGGWRSGGGGI